MMSVSSESQYVKIVFVGLCERATCVPVENTNIPQWNVIGLKQVVLLPIYPMTLNAFIAGFCFGFWEEDTIYDICICDENGAVVGSFSIKRTPDSEVGDLDNGSNKLLITNFGADWCQVFVPLSNANIIITKPGNYTVKHISNGNSKIIGGFQCAVYDPIPLSKERELAIQNDPTAANSVTISYGCKNCLDSISAYVSLDRRRDDEDKSLIWYQDLPDSFDCKCGKVHYDLRILQKNMHGMLGCREKCNVPDLMPLYEKGSLQNILNKFKNKYFSDVKEEVLQKFIEENIILLHQFPALKVFIKPPILTFYFADFAILTPQRELVLIEIERPQIQLLKKDGGTSSQLNHAIDQVRDWIHVASEHRQAFLDSISVEKDKVSKIRGVVIAGRDSGCDAMHLRKLKSFDFGQIQFLTYDDLYYALLLLIQKI